MMTGGAGVSEGTDERYLEIDTRGSGEDDGS